jgi:hypothetical protein
MGGATDYAALVSAIGGILTLAIMIWIAYAGRSKGFLTANAVLTSSIELAHDRASCAISPLAFVLDEETPRSAMQGP